jgi:hypothetical protein
MADARVLHDGRNDGVNGVWLPGALNGNTSMAEKTPQRIKIVLTKYVLQSIT